FSPICNPINCGWGKGCFSAYLGEDTAAWREYDATELVNKGAKVTNILIDQGIDDEFYDEKQLLPENFQAACDKAGQPVTLRFQEGYDHSYHFIASFIGEHIAYHAKALNASL
ncbi:MAG: S-formylglutathione hydrolase, partial [Cocleimonas sp.]|nr:S-formylglutathione hydrolase [Cocleimonas sp.]